MPDPTPTEPTPTGASSTPPGTSTGGAAPTTPAASPASSAPATPAWQPPPGAPEWAQDPARLYQVATSAYGILQKFNQTGSLPTQPQPTPAQPPVPAGQPAADDDLVSWGQVKQYLEQMGQPIAQQSRWAIEQAASANLAVVQQKHAKDFERWGPEIHTLLANIPKDRWGLDNLEQVVKVVRADHVDELAAERARDLAPTLVPTMRSNGASPGAGGPSSPNGSWLDRETIPEAWRVKARDVGLTDAEIHEFCRTTGRTPEQLFQGLAEGKFIAAAVADNRIDPRNFQRRPGA